MLPLVIVKSILDWIKEHISLLYLLLLIPILVIYMPVVFSYLLIYSALESLNYSQINSLVSPEDLMKI